MRYAYTACPHGALRKRALNVLLHISAVCICSRTWYTPAIFLFILGPNPVLMYIDGVSILVLQAKVCGFRLRDSSSGLGV